MKIPSFSACLIGCFLGLAICQPQRLMASSQQTLVLSERLPANGTLVLTLNVGDVHIVPNSDADRLRVEIQADSSLEEERSWVKQFEVAGDRATVEIKSPKDHEHCVSCYSNREVTVYIPQQTAIKLEVEIGDVTVKAIKGDKQIRLGIGDLSIGVGDQNEYGRIDLSTRIGDVDDSVYHSEAHGFLGKSETIGRGGRYHLRAHVGIGDLKLLREKS